MRPSRHTWPAMLLTLLAALTPLAAAPAATLDDAQLVVAGDAINKGQDWVSSGELARWLMEDRRDYLLIDVRPAVEFQAGHIDGAVNLPLRQLFEPQRIAELPAGRLLVLYGNGEVRAAQAALMLRLAGRDAYALQGGFERWALQVLSPQSVPPDAPRHEQLDAARRAAIARALKNCDLPCYQPPAPSGGYTPPLAPVETAPVGIPAKGGGVLLDEGC